MAFVQGYISSLTVNGTSVEIWSSSATLSQTREVIDKTTLGLTQRTKISGLGDGSCTIEMHLDTVGVGLMQAAYASVDPVVVVFRPGQLGGPDAGEWTFNAFITDFSVPGSVDDNWQMNLTMDITGPTAPAYTAPV